MTVQRERGHVVLIVGLLTPARSRVERRLQHVTVRSLLTRRDGSLVLEDPEAVAIRRIDQIVDQAGGHDKVLILELNYANLPAGVRETISAYHDIGTLVVRSTPGRQPWPNRPKNFDNDFQACLTDAIVDVVVNVYPAPSVADDVGGAHDSVKFELLRGLASHSKMGPNNHSHEDDLWKGRGKNLKPSEKNDIVAALMKDGLIDRKKNASMGGTGWVYWIANVSEAGRRYPALRPYFG